jgi:hypothetical protein
VSILETDADFAAWSIRSARIRTPRAGGAQRQLERISEMLLDRRSALAAEIIRQVRNEIPDYRSPSAESLEHITRHIDVLAQMVRGADVGTQSLEFIIPHAVRRARDGVPLPSFLHAFRVAIRVLWDTTVEFTGEDVQARAATLSAARPFLECLNAASTQAAAAYLEAQQPLIAEGAGARRDLLEQLLAGRPLDGPRTVSLAAEAGLCEGTNCAVIVATHGGPLEPLAMRSAMRVLVQAATHVTRPLNVARHDELVIVRAIRAEELRELSRRLRDACATLAAADVEVRVGVSTAHESLAAVPAAYAEARNAVDGLSTGPGVVSLSELSPIDYLAAHADDVAPRLIPAAIQEFISEDLDRDGVLIETVLAYAASDMSLVRTAERLHVHVNTARYRLARVSERTGRDPRSLSNVLDLVLAIKMLGAAPGGAPA